MSCVLCLLHHARNLILVGLFWIRPTLVLQQVFWKVSYRKNRLPVSHPTCSVVLLFVSSDLGDGVFCLDGILDILGLPNMEHKLARSPYPRSPEANFDHLTPANKLLETQQIPFSTPLNLSRSSVP